jgi:hypothetical protein
MFYEDVKLVKGDTVWDLAIAYGYKGPDWKKIWDDPKNKALTSRRGRPESLAIGDVLMIPIPWKVISKTLNVEARGVGFTVKRDGEKGSRLRWAQTVYQHNQAVAGTSPFCVDACPPDDNDPFYWTSAELTADPTRRKTFIDHPKRSPPSAAKGTTKWRAVLSIAVVTGKRVTVFESLVWGFDMTTANTITKVGPRAAKANEVTGHVTLLQKGKGTGPDNFGKAGWTFRKP